MHRRLAFDFLEDRAGKLFLAMPGGLYELSGGSVHILIPGGPLLNDSLVVLCQTRDESLWAGSYGQGLWRWKDGKSTRYTIADGLSNDQIRALQEDSDGTLWIGTFGGGLNALRNGRFFHVTTKDGLLSDNISHVEDDGQGSLWLSTTRGICRVTKQELHDFASGKIRSRAAGELRRCGRIAQRPVRARLSNQPRLATRTDGRLWFPTSRGLGGAGSEEEPPSVAYAGGTFAGRHGGWPRRRL